MKNRIINRTETFKLISEKDSSMNFDELNKHSDRYWEDVCNNLDITAAYTEAPITTER